MPQALLHSAPFSRPSTSEPRYYLRISNIWFGVARYLLNPFDEAERLAQDRGNWIVATVDPRMSWPTRKQVVVYEDMDFVLFPQSNNADQNAGIALRADRYGLDAHTARSEIMRFCSALSWAERAGIEILTWSGGNLPRPIHVRRGRAVVDYLEADHLASISGICVVTWLGVCYGLLKQT